MLLDDNNGKFEKSMNPVYDQHGLVTYYQQSKDIYDKATKLYDRNGDFVRSQNSDNLEATIMRLMRYRSIRCFRQKMSRFPTDRAKPMSWKIHGSRRNNIQMTRLRR
ncbi:hypothetical protein DXA97_10435 [Clostridium sp. OF09-36]|nr:hypothetical protein DXA97_10435 [Clostridium sp. OF09-36]